MSMSTKRISALLALALLAGACGTDSEDVSAGDDTAGVPPAAGACLAEDPDCEDSSAPGDELPPPGDEPGLPSAPQPELVTPEGNTSRTHPVIWQEILDSGEEDVLRLGFTGGVAPCFVLDRVDVVETDESVTVTLYAGTAKGSEDQACIEIAKYYAVDVPLDGPLGERDVVDGAADG